MKAQWHLPDTHQSLRTGALTASPFPLTA